MSRDVSLVEPPMLATSVLVFVMGLCLAAASPASAEDAVRPMDAIAAEAFEFGVRSPAFRALVARFDATRVVVHVVSGDTQVFGARGATRLAGVVRGWRYVRVVLDPHLRIRDRAAVLAHELQHAHEIIGAEAATQRDVRQLYERIGRPVNGMSNTFETAEAAAAGVRVWHELRESEALARRASR